MCFIMGNSPSSFGKIVIWPGDEPNTVSVPSHGAFHYWGKSPGEGSPEGALVEYYGLVAVAENAVLEMPHEGPR